MENFQQLVKRGLDYNARGKKKRSLLHAAVKQFGGVEIVRHLVSLKLDPNARDKYKQTPLHYAVTEGYFRAVYFVQVLLENGANVKAKNKYGQTALHLFAQKSYAFIEATECLTKKGAKLNDRDNNGNTATLLRLVQGNQKFAD